MKERQALKEDLEVTKTALVNTQRLKNDLDADVSQLREKVTELSLREDDRAAGTQFTCFTSTKVQMLTQRAVDARGRPRRRYAVYLLY
jgi:predicted  nucleic acid-binding Zn-ribbon protein